MPLKMDYKLLVPVCWSSTCFSITILPVWTKSMGLILWDPVLSISSISYKYDRYIAPVFMISIPAVAFLFLRLSSTSN